MLRYAWEFCKCFLKSLEGNTKQQYLRWCEFPENKETQHDLQIWTVKVRWYFLNDMLPTDSSDYAWSIMIDYNWLHILRM